MISSIYSDKTLSISVRHDGRVRILQVDQSHPNFKVLIERLDDPDVTVEEIVELADPAAAVKAAILGMGQVTFENGQLFYNNQPVSNFLSTLILKVYSEGRSVEPWVNFAEKVYQNPFAEARDELAEFMVANQLPIDPDGDFYAYKEVTGDYMDGRTSTFDNSVGSICEMPRDKVDPDRRNLCSNGLHFGGRKYYADGPYDNSWHHLMEVKINPADVVSIPAEYNLSKGRCCRYLVTAEVEEGHNPHSAEFSTVGAIVPDGGDDPGMDLLDPVVTGDHGNDHYEVYDMDGENWRLCLESAGVSGESQDSVLVADFPKDIYSTPEDVINSFFGSDAAVNDDEAARLAAEAEALEAAANIEPKEPKKFIQTEVAGRLTPTKLRKLLKQHGGVMALSRHFNIAHSTVGTWKRNLGL